MIVCRFRSWRLAFFAAHGPGLVVNGYFDMSAGSHTNLVIRIDKIPLCPDSRRPFTRSTRPTLHRSNVQAQFTFPAVRREPTRAAALKQLEAFLPHSGTGYAKGRNIDPGPEARGSVSRLSPYLRHRILNETEVLAAVMNRHGYRDAEKFIQEVFWRTYFKGHLEEQPLLWVRYCWELAQARRDMGQDAGHKQRYQIAVEGRTGIEAFDYWAHELKAHNYLHNHARMWFASIWVFTLNLPWQLGADFFMQHLLDGDPASNTLSWRWVAGLHTPGKHYLARSENIAKFSNSRFPLTPQLNEQAEPLTEEPLRDWAVRLNDQLFELPMVPEGAIAHQGTPFAVLLHEDDLYWPELTDQATDCAVLCTSTGKTGAGYAHRVAEFVHALCRNRSSRLSVPLLDTTETDQVLKWSRSTSCGTVVTPYAPVGPVQDTLREVGRTLAREGIVLIAAQRQYDQVAWPHCKKGFFQLKKQIPRLLEFVI